MKVIIKEQRCNLYVNKGDTVTIDLPLKQREASRTLSDVIPGYYNSFIIAQDTNEDGSLQDPDNATILLLQKKDTIPLGWKWISNLSLDQLCNYINTTNYLIKFTFQ